MRIGIVTKGIPPFQIGGPEKYSDALATGLARRGIKCCVIVRCPQLSSFEREYTVLPVRSATRWGTALFNLNFLEFYEATYKACKAFDLDLVNIQNAGLEELASSLAARALSIPIVVTIHGLLFSLSAIRPGSLVARLVAKNASKIVVISPYVSDFLFSRYGFLGIPREKVIVIPVPVDAKKFNPRLTGEWIRRKHYLENSFVILSVSRLSKVKGTEYLIHAVKLASNKIANLKLLIVGDGSEKEKLKVITERMGLSDRVIFVGRVPEDHLPYYYACCDIFAVASIHEGLPQSILEALASGKPVIATKVGAIPRDLIKDGYNGMLVDSRNSFSLSKAIEVLFKDEAMREEFSIQGRKSIERKYDWDLLVSSYERLYRELIEDNL